MMQQTLAPLGSLSVYLTVLLLLCHNAHCYRFTSLAKFGIQPNNKTPHIIDQNTKLFSKLLGSDGATSSSLPLHLIVEKNQTYYFRHGVHADGIQNVIFLIDGTIQFVRDTKEKWSKTTDINNGKRPMACMYLSNVTNVTFTSSYRFGKDDPTNRGIIHGGGQDWWGIPGLGYVRMQEHRPILLQIEGGHTILLENLVLLDSPFWTIKMGGIHGAIVRHSSIIATRTPRNGHDLVDMTAFNTDGIDVAGHNVHVHDVDIWNQDDCIAVKDNDGADHVSSNMLFERIHASGLGLVIGSIGSNSTVRNITFRDSFLYSTFKGIYMKFRAPDNCTLTGLIQDIMYDNITMESPEQWGIWIGPAQQLRTIHGTCDLSWPTNPLAMCATPPSSTFKNITIQNITMNNPKRSPGVILGSKENPIDGIVFNNVVVTHQSPPLLLPQNRFDFFPGLKTRDPIVNDIYLQRGNRLLYGVGSIVIIMACVLIGRNMYRPRRDIHHDHIQLPQNEEEIYEDEPRDQEVNDNANNNAMVNEQMMIQDTHYTTRRLIRICKYLVPVSLMLFLIFWVVVVHKKMDNSAKYFVCDGVINGIAKGITWPVPYCFKDET